jgi:hypothetical protein
MSPGSIRRTKDPGAARERRDAEVGRARHEAREAAPRGQFDAIVVDALAPQPGRREDRARDRPVGHEEVAAAAEHAQRDPLASARGDDVRGLLDALRLEEELGDAADAERRPVAERRGGNASLGEGAG